MEIALRQKLLDAKDWRVGEIAELKTVALRAGLSNTQKDVVRKYTIPAFYSLWEGYFKESIGFYIESVNAMNLRAGDLAPVLLAHAIDTKYKLNKISGEFEKRAALIHGLHSDLVGFLLIPAELPTESNIRTYAKYNISNI